MKAVVLAGGKGTRLRPVTYETPKALITVNNRSLLDHAIDLFWKYHIYEIWFSLGDKWSKIKEEFPTIPFWVDVGENGELKQLGTGGWINKLSHDGQIIFTEDFYVLNADNLIDADLASLREKHKANDCLVTVYAVAVDDVSQYGALETKGDKVTAFTEKGNTGSGLINSGLYIFSPEIFDYIKKLGKAPHEPFSLEKDLFTELAKDGKLGYHESECKWFDTGTMERWERAIKEWTGLTR